MIPAVDVVEINRLEFSSIKAILDAESFLPVRLARNYTRPTLHPEAVQAIRYRVETRIRSLLASHGIVPVKVRFDLDPGYVYSPHEAPKADLEIEVEDKDLDLLRSLA